MDSLVCMTMEKPTYLRMLRPRGGGRGEGDALKHMKQYYPNVKQIAISEHQLSNLCFSEPTKIMIFAMHSVSLSEGVIHTSIPVVESKPLEGDGICFEYLYTVAQKHL